MRYQTLHVRPRADREPGAEPRDGEMPAVLSRQGKDSLGLAIDRAQFAKAVRRTGVGGIMQLVEEGTKEKHLGMLKELQWHPVTRRLQHASFQEVQQNQVVNTAVPVILVGDPRPVVDKTGQLIKNQESIEVHAKVTNLPNHVAIDIGRLEVGDVVNAGDVVLPEGCEAAHPDFVICSLTTPTVVSLEPEIPTEEPEIVGEEAEGEVEGEPAEEAAEPEPSE